MTAAQLIAKVDVMRRKGYSDPTILEQLLLDAYLELYPDRAPGWEQLEGAPENVLRMYAGDR